MYVLISWLVLSLIHPLQIVGHVDCVSLFISQQITWRQAITGTREGTKKISYERTHFCRVFYWQSSSSKEKESFIRRTLSTRKIKLAFLLHYLVNPLLPNYVEILQMARHFSWLFAPVFFLSPLPVCYVYCLLKFVWVSVLLTYHNSLGCPCFSSAIYAQNIWVV